MRRFVKPCEMRPPKLIRFGGTNFSSTGNSKKVNFIDQNKQGRGIPDVNKLYNEKCSCNREKTIVFCRSCGYYLKNSRVSVSCIKHPRVKFLHDIVECPRCRSNAFLDESP